MSDTTKAQATTVNHSAPAPTPAAQSQSQPAPLKSGTRTKAKKLDHHLAERLAALGELGLPQTEVLAHQLHFSLRCYRCRKPVLAYLDNTNSSTTTLAAQEHEAAPDQRQPAKDSVTGSRVELELAAHRKIRTSVAGSYQAICQQCDQARHFEQQTTNQLTPSNSNSSAGNPDLTQNPARPTQAQEEQN